MGYHGDGQEPIMTNIKHVAPTCSIPYMGKIHGAESSCYVLTCDVIS